MRPYERIADTLRRRIERGEITVGDRVPPTREIARKFNVALATAAHALRVLADEGVVIARPRVGNIVASPRARAQAANERAERSAGAGLSRAGIVAAAIAIADSEGLAAVSLRAIAAQVGAPVMTLHRHVGSKDELLRSMTDAALGEESLPTSPPSGWRAQLEIAARAEWAVFRKHPWLVRVMSLTRPEPLPNALAYADWVLRALGSTGIEANLQMRIHVILHGYVQGIAVNVESEAEALSETGLDENEWMAKRQHAFRALAESGRYPSFAKTLFALREFDIDFDDLFERGLSALLDGFAPLLDRANRRPPRKKIAAVSKTPKAARLNVAGRTRGALRRGSN